MARVDDFTKAEESALKRIRRSLGISPTQQPKALARRLLALCYSLPIAARRDPSTVAELAEFLMLVADAGNRGETGEGFTAHDAKAIVVQLEKAVCSIKATIAHIQRHQEKDPPGRAGR